MNGQFVYKLAAEPSCFENDVCFPSAKVWIEVRAPSAPLTFFVKSSGGASILNAKHNARSGFACAQRTL